MKRKGISIQVNRNDRRKDAWRIAAELIIAMTLTFALWLMLYHGLNLGKADKFWFTGGLPVLADRFIDRVVILTNRIYMGVDAEAGAFQTIFTPLMIAVTGALSFLAVRLKHPVIVILYAALGLAGVCSGIIPLSLWVIFFFAALALAECYRRFASAACRKHFRNAALLSAGTLGIACLAGFLIAASGLAGDTVFSEIKEKADLYQHQKEYEAYANPLPEGRVSRAGSFSPGDGPALEVSMANWETTYLKGFVGEQYENGKWVRTSGERVLKNADLFYWLHEDGFYGQEQVADAFQLAGKKAEGFVSVTAMRACRQYRYIPYGLSQGENAFLPKDRIGDLNDAVSDADSSADYIFNIVEGSVEDSRDVQKAIIGKSKSTEAESNQYLDHEETYRKACRRDYLAVPDDIKAVLRQALGEQEKLQPGDAMDRILKYMNENVRYSEKAKPAGDTDFVVRFLTGTRKGYCIHYASAAVMMLRYFGVPARYAEGFIIPDTLYEDAAPMSSMIVPMKYSHAWAEYYLDGVGWLPFETVPKYQQSGVSGLDQDKSGGKNQQQEEKKDQNKKIENPLNRVGAIFKLNLPLIIGAGIVLLLALLILLFLRRRKLKRFLATFNGEDTDLGARNAFAYAITLLKASGMKINNTMLRESLAACEAEPDLKADMETGIVINEASKYGGKAAGEEEREAMLRLKERAAEVYREKRKFTGKVYDRFVRSIY